MDNLSNKSNKKIVSVLKAPYSISLDITNKCNFRCLHCYNRSGENFTIEDELSDEEIIEFIKEVSNIGLENFCFCGGEPLLRKNLIVQCAKILAEKKVRTIAIVTNGFLVDEEVAQELHEAGINSAQVSLDGSTADTYEHIRGVKGSFQRAINALKLFKKVGIKQVSSAFCPTSFNYMQIEEVYNICAEIGVDLIRVQQLMLIGRAVDNLNIRPSDLEYRKLVSCINRLKKDRRGTHIEWDDPIQHLINYRNISDNTNPIINIRANGGIAISPYLPVELGNLRRHSITEYWESGLGFAWKLEKIKQLAGNINCIEDMGIKHKNIPEAWKEKDMVIDIIDDLNEVQHI